MKRVLVTGGAGFIGSHLCRSLLADGHTVVCLDNLYSGQLHNLTGLSGNSRFHTLIHDVCDPIFVECDQIYNLACPASPPYYQKDPVGTVVTNVRGAINMLNLARRTGATILQASTSEVYGDPKITPQYESYRGWVNTCGPRACYDEGKRCAETLFWDYHTQYNVDIRIARIFNTYGPNMRPDDGRVISNFIVNALQNNPLPVYGSGHQTRSFCYIDDMIEGLKLLMDTQYHYPINLGNPEEININQLAYRIIQLTESTSKPVSLKRVADDPMQRCPEITRAESTLKWHPTTCLDRGLRETINYFSKEVLLWEDRTANAD